MDALKPFMPLYVVHDHEGDPASMTMEEITGRVEEAEGATRLSILHQWASP